MTTTTAHAPPTVPPDSPTAANRIVVVGIGDDGAVLLTARTRGLVEGATLLVGGARHLAFFPRHPARWVTINTDLAYVVRQIRAAAVHERVVVLASGDPLCFGIGALLAEKLG